MSLSTQHIIRHLFQAESLKEVSRQQLEELVEEYPSFGVGRYLLSRKLQAEGADNFNEETQKTNLYFTNPFWLQWLLQDAARPSGGIEPVPREIQEEITPPGQWDAAGDAELPAEEVFAPVTDPTEETIDTIVTPESEPDETGGAMPLAETQEESRPPSAADELMKSIAEFQEQRRSEQAAAVEEKETPSMGIAGLALEQAEELTPPEASIAGEPVAGETHGEGTEFPVEAAGSGEQTSFPVEEVHAEARTPVVEVSPEAPAATEEAPGHGQGTDYPAEPVIVAGENHTGEKVPEAPLFEPYYTVDYFASQGIRLVLDENPTDKLGKQMKSFTDWLKVMRRLPQKTREIIPDIAAEHQVQAIAAHSIERREVITETMAEVLAMQGMREKATEMYRKLSLLEPEKSAYFAEKIEQLKII
ncbi:hypothetical protein Q4E93_13440 [Flavitalea sp. BT771]|uniref:hypothetical protein n=1 Tax=Flavitalea sp. BT771 TaxID=3063329 RepID=UPI0026E47C61|nr:hypothetical protein [Flavitalea sp. BT771]MDO6431602.1 hypothetical protein [Flavitalea sp. BT771]MDV6220510.1 hypothetical protein [Flavitalea sp. BT771]